MNGKSEKLLAFLGKGKKKAQSVPEIADSLGLTAREVSALANDLRTHNYNVVSDEKGLYLAETDEEIKAFVIRQHNRAVSSLKGITHMRNYLKSKGLLPKGY